MQDYELLRIIGASLVIVGALLKWALKTRRPPIGQIIMVAIWLGVSLIIIGYVWGWFGSA